jgi:catechol 2,3-dioxygenase-like lactoylglutathione lyase family enzyme
MNVQELRIVLTVDDFDKAIHFYRDVLGFESVESWNRADGRGAILAIQNTTLELFDKPQAESVDDIEAGQRTSGQIRLALQVDDVESAASQLGVAGASIIHAPVQTPWGHYNQRLQTPDGLQLTLFQTEGKSE